VSKKSFDLESERASINKVYNTKRSVRQLMYAFERRHVYRKENWKLPQGQIPVAFIMEISRPAVDLGCLEVTPSGMKGS